MAVGDIVYNPYEGVGSIEWDADTALSGDDVYARKANPHSHPCSYGNTEVVKLYAGLRDDHDGNSIEAGEEHQIVGAYTQGQSTGWPYDLDAVAEGLIVHPAHETDPADHMTVLFSTVNNGDIPSEVPTDRESSEDQRKVIETILETDGPAQAAGYGPLTAYAHPSSYHDSADDVGDYYDENLDRWSRLDGLIGFETFTYRTLLGGDGPFDPDLSLKIYEAVLSRRMPWDLRWCIAGDDARCSSDEYLVGNQADRNWTTVLLHDDEFRPERQRRSREIVARRLTEGRAFAHRVVSWDPDTEEKPTYPKVMSVTVNDNKITLEATDWDEIEWRSNGEVVGSGLSYQVTEDDVPFVLARLQATGSDPVGETLTQPFAVDDGDLARINPETGAQINADETKFRS